MTNENAIAINRAKPLLREAAEKHEAILITVRQCAELAGQMGDEARAIGRLLDSAKLAIKASGIDATFDEALRAHAPNIEPRQADKYIRWSRGEVGDPWQLWFAPFIARALPPSTEPAAAKPEPYERAYRLAFDLRKWTRDNPVESWPANAQDAIRREVEPLARALWPQKFPSE